MAYRSLHSVDELLWRAPLPRSPSTLALRRARLRRIARIFTTL
ncbi:Ferric reductase (1.6.99.14) [Cronobacter sakazakii 701]|nr:Ferric reductase (1.6.99.14) [Cronobacter sakazakii 701]